MRILPLFAAAVLAIICLSSCASRDRADGQIYPGDVPKILYAPPKGGGFQGGK